MNNIAEMCFNHVYPRKQADSMKDELNQTQMDACITKYMKAFKVVQ